MKSALSCSVVAFTILLASPHTHAADSTKSDPPKPEAAVPAPAATPAKPFELPETVAVVEGTEIKKAELEEALNAAISQAGKKPDDLPREQREQAYRSILNDMIIDKLVLKRAEKEAVTDAEVDAGFAKLKTQFESEDQMNAEMKQAGQTVEKIKESIRTAMKQQKWVDSQIAGKTGVSEADAQKFYDSEPDSFKAPEMVRASHILIAVPEDAKPDVVAEKEKTAKEVDARVKKGEAFDKVAAEKSDDPGSKANGGDLDFFTKDRMVPEFADAAFKMKKGEISDPVKTKFGWHIIKVTDKKEARTVPFSEAKEKIVAYLQEQKRHSAVDEVITNLRSKAEVKVNLPEPAATKTEEAK